MITAVHTLLYCDDPAAARRFLRDVLGWPAVDSGGGWLIFRAGPAEMAAHPTSGDEGWSSSPHHEITLMCDDIESTMADLAAKGALFTRPVRDDGWGLTTSMAVPGAGELMLYEAKHLTAHDL